MSHDASVTLRPHPTVVIYLTFLQHISQTSRSGKAHLWKSQMERTIYGKFLQKQNSINITCKCRLNVFSNRKTYYVCSTIWTNKFLRIFHCGFVTLRSESWHVTILTHSIPFEYIYFMCKEQII